MVENSALYLLIHLLATPTVKIVLLFDKTVESIYCVQMVKAGSIHFPVIAVFNNAVCDPRKGMVTAQPVTKDKGSIRNMAFKNIKQFLCAGFCAVDSGRKRFPSPLALDTRADTQVFAGNAPLFGFCAMSERVPFGCGIHWSAFIAVQDKFFVNFGHILQADTCHLWEFLECQQDLMAYVKGYLMVQSKVPGGIIYGIAMQGVRDYFLLDRCREVRICHDGI